jgi:hypothetical protein
MRRGKLLEEIRVDMREMSARAAKMHIEMRDLREEVRAEQRFGNELLRRHELVMTDVLNELRELRAESRAHTQAILTLLDRLNGGGAAPAT